MPWIGTEVEREPLSRKEEQALEQARSHALPYCEKSRHCLILAKERVLSIDTDVNNKEARITDASRGRKNINQGEDIDTAKLPMNKYIYKPGKWMSITVCWSCNSIILFKDYNFYQTIKLVVVMEVVRKITMILFLAVLYSLVHVGIGATKGM